MGQCSVCLTVCPMCQCVSSVSVTVKLWPGKHSTVERWWRSQYYSACSPPVLSLTRDRDRITRYPAQDPPPSRPVLKGKVLRWSPDGKFARQRRSVGLCVRRKIVKLTINTGKVCDWSVVTLICNLSLSFYLSLPLSALSSFPKKNLQNN